SFGDDRTDRFTSPIWNERRSVFRRTSIHVDGDSALSSWTGDSWTVTGADVSVAHPSIAGSDATARPVPTYWRKVRRDGSAASVVGRGASSSARIDVSGAR